MSDIFKRIKSIDVDDDASRKSEKTPFSSLGLRPVAVASNPPSNIDTPPSPPEVEDIPLELQEDLVMPDSEPEPEVLRPAASRPIDTEPVPEFITRQARVSDAVAPPPPLRDAPRFGWVGWLGTLCVILWLVCSTAIAYGFYDLNQGLEQMTPLQMGGLALLIVAPALMIFVATYALVQLKRLTVHAHDLQHSTYALTHADDTVVSRTAIMAQSLKQELSKVDQHLDASLSRLAVLEDTVKTQVSEITRSAQITDATTARVKTTISEQHDNLKDIAEYFDERLTALSVTMSDHTGQLDTATRLAEQKIQEARVSVEGAAAKINAASDIVRQNSIEAASTLTASHEEISHMGEMISARSQELDNVYRKHAVELTAMIEALRDEQENLGVSLEARLAKMRDVSLSAQVSADSLTKASVSGKETVEALAGAARLTDTAVKKRFTEMEEMVKYSNARAESISETAARRVQDSLSHTRKEIARIENDMMALQDRLNTPRLRTELSQAPVDPDIRPDDNPTPAPAQITAKKRLWIQPVEDDVDTSDTLDIPQPEEEETNIQVPADVVLEPEIVAPTDDDLDLSLAITPVNTREDLHAPNPDEDILSFDTDVVRASILNDDKPAKSKFWKWGKKASKPDIQDSPVAEMPPLSQPEETVAEVGSAKYDQDDIVTILSNMGLGPSAIVDDGSIIEATNTRRSRGATAMSQAMAHRLSEPVQHLKNAFEFDAGLEQKLQKFTHSFQNELAAVSDNREGIRTTLESELGRAFLMCDAALNG